MDTGASHEIASGSGEESPSHMDSLKSLINGMSENYKVLAERLMEKPPRILLIGSSGVGKSTLLNNVFGFSSSQGAEVRAGGRPCTQEFMEYGPFPHCPVRIVDSKGIERETAERARDDIVRYLRCQRESSKDVADHVHVVWYLPGDRWDSIDVSYVRKLKNQAPVIAIVTKCDTDMRNQIDQRTGKPAKDVTHDEIKAAFPEVPVIFCGDPRRSKNWLPAKCSAGHNSSRYFSSKNMDKTWKCEFPLWTAPDGICGEEGQVKMFFFGYKELAKKTKEAIPEVARISFLHAQRTDIESKNKEAANIISMNVAAAVGVAIVPLAVPDAPALLAIEGNMTVSLFQLYNIPTTFLDVSVFAAINGATIGGVAMFSYTAAKLLKCSGIGAAAGSTVDGVVAAVAGVVIGIAVARVCAGWSLRKSHEEELSANEFSTLVADTMKEMTVGAIAKAVFMYVMTGKTDEISSIITESVVTRS